MAIQKPNELNFSNKSLVIVVYGQPGAGKTTLACSAPNPLVLDTDKGIARVNPEHRQDTSSAKDYEEILADVNEAAKLGYTTLIIDTVGALLDSMKAKIIKDNPKMAKSDGTLSLQGFGSLKALFLNFSADVRSKFMNTIFIFHEYTQRDGDNVFYDIIAEGSAKTLVWQPADLGARLFIQDNKRYLSFSPCENWYAKGAYGIKGLMELPELKAGEPNDFLTKLFKQVRKNLENETKQLDQEQAIYEKALAFGEDFIELVENPESVEECINKIKGLQHALTSEKELMAMLKKRLAALHITYDKENKKYIYNNENV